MSMPFQSFVLTQAISLSALNAAMNGAYTWFLWRADPALPVFGPGSVGVDLASTPMWIAALSTLLGAASIRKSLSTGRVALPHRATLALAPRLPSGPAFTLRALSLVIIAALSLSLPIAMMLHASGVETLSPTTAVALKVVLTVILTLAIVPVVILSVAADVDRALVRAR